MVPELILRVIPIIEGLWNPGHGLPSMLMECAIRVAPFVLFYFPFFSFRALSCRFSGSAENFLRNGGVESSGASLWAEFQTTSDLPSFEHSVFDLCFVDPKP